MPINETSLINVIAINATAESAPPGTELPEKYSNIPSWSGWTTIGSRDRGHNIDLDDAAVNMPMVREVIAIQPPRAGAPQKHILRRNGAGEFSFVCYDIAQALGSLDSALVIGTDNVGRHGTTLTARTVCVELDGIALVRFPKAQVLITEIPAGYGEDGVAKFNVNVKPEGTSETRGGVEVVWYQPGTE